MLSCEGGGSRVGGLPPAPFLPLLPGAHKLDGLLCYFWGSVWALQPLPLQA